MRYKLVDPAAFQAMQIVKVPDQELLLSERMIEFVRIWAKYDPPMAAQYDVQELEFDPAKIVQEAACVPHLQALTRINQAARAVTLAFGSGSDLDAIASRYPGGVPRVSSEIYSPSDTVLERMRKDARYRDRIWLAPYTFSMAGTAEGYEFFVKTALPDAFDVTAVSIRRPDECVALITIYMDRDDPIPTTDELLTARRYLVQEDVQPLSDVISIQGAIPRDFAYQVDYWIKPGADKDTSEALLRKALVEKFISLRGLGNDHTPLEINSAMKVSGIHSAVVRGFPPRGLQADRQQFVRVTSLDLFYRGEDE